MSTTEFDSAFQRVKELAADFEANRSHYLASTYQEAEVRRDFIDKFFAALGWDVNHETQKNPYEQEVKVERGVAVGGGQRRADYAFFVTPNFRDVRFYVEAKKPSGTLVTPENYFQTISYGWNSSTPLGVLTDFDQLHILDCRYKPDPATALNRAVEKFYFADYSDPDKFARIYWLFSREAVLGGSLEKRAAELPKPRAKGRTGVLSVADNKTVDESFLEKLDEFRTVLAKAFKSGNANLDSETLTEMAQRTLDRLVFIRFLEDKGLEDQRLVEKFGDKDSAWEDFVATSRRLDGIYNGIVFKAHALLDRPGFRLDQEAFAVVCKNISHAHSSFNFDAIPIHILGSIYERFLGKVIHATAKQVKVQDKPEVRKAGGVYYTPEYIVRYIVENTVGKLIAGKTPDEIADMHFADIACGSGSFLLGVYDLLLTYHGNWYNQNPSKVRKGDCIEREGRQFLSLRKKRDILLNNIFGVDIDAQAVEVCQLSLYLKLLQGETASSTHQHLLDFEKQALLPTLTKNIVCGNSLIGTDILDGQLFAGDEERKLNPMNFEDAFPHIFKRRMGMVRETPATYGAVKSISREGGRLAYHSQPASTLGFDAIVGNPPYVRIQGFPRDQITYLTDHYCSVTGNCDLYVSFVERAYRLLKDQGLLGYIIPNKFFRTDYGTGLRNYLATEHALREVVDFGSSQVFDATTYTCLLFLTHHEQASLAYSQVVASAINLSQAQFISLQNSSFSEAPWLFTDSKSASLIELMSFNSTRLLDVPVAISRGSSTGDDTVFVVPAASTLEKGALRIPIYASDFNRYVFNQSREWRVIFPYEIEGNAAALITEADFSRRYPKAFAHLKALQGKLEQRKQSGPWLGFSAQRNLPLHDEAQIVIPLLAEKGQFALIPQKLRGKLCPMASGGFTITVPKNCPVSAEYLLGLLNSRLLYWRLKQMSNVFRGGWITCTKQYFGELPIKIASRAHQDQIERYVIQIIEAKQQAAQAQTEKDKNYYENKCAALDRQIDRLVYDLYGLNEEEIAIVGGTPS